MRKVKVRAYGGTGALLARTFVDLLIVNPIRDAKVDIDLLDLDQSAQQGQNGGSQNDFQDVLNAVNAYKALHELGLQFIAIPMVSDPRKPLQDIRKRALGIAEDEESTFDYSVKSVFDTTAQTLMLSCMTLNQYVAQNADGCHADLSRNAMIAYAMQTSPEGFARAHGQKLEADDIVIYMGSTDGGTANTFIDPDLKALIKRNVEHAGDREKFRVYSVRTLPYKRIPVPIGNAEAEARNEDLVAKSVGVLRNIEAKPGYVATYQEDESGGYELINTDYLLDALAFVGTNTTDASNLEDTNVKQGDYQPADQHHKSHTTELVAALTMIDPLFQKLGNPSKSAYYIYKDDCTDHVTYSLDAVPMPAGKGGSFVEISMSRRIKGFLSLYTLVKFHLIDAVGIIARKDVGNRDKVSENIRGIFGAIYNYKRKPKLREKAKQLAGFGGDVPFDILTDNPDAGGVFRAAEIEVVKATLESFIKNATPFVKMLNETDPCFDGITDMGTKFTNLLEGSGNPYCDPSIIVINNKAAAERVLGGYLEKEKSSGRFLKMRGICATETGSDARSTQKEDAERIGRAIAVKLLDGLYLELIIRDSARAVNQN